MKTAIILIALAAGAASAQTYVAPYVKSDGTFVEGHFKSAPNSTTYDNYSTKGNVNPYTGKAGTADANDYKAPTYQAPKPYVYKPYGSK